MNYIVIQNNIILYYIMGSSYSLVKTFTLTPSTKIIDIVKYITIVKDYERVLIKDNNVYNNIYGFNKKIELDVCRREIDKCFNMINYCKITGQIKDKIDWSCYNSNNIYDHCD